MTLEDDLWYQPVFDADRPAFFATSREDVEMWAARGGVVLTARLAVTNPAREEVLLTLAEELGLPDVFDEDFVLYEPRVRRRLEELGYDAYRGEDGYLFVTVVWNPDLIQTVSLEPWDKPGTGITP